MTSMNYFFSIILFIFFSVTSMKLIDHHLILLHRYYLINQAFTQQHHCGRIDSNQCKTDRMITFSHKYICSRTSSLSVATSSFREQWRKGEQSLFFTFFAFFICFEEEFHFISCQHSSFFSLRNWSENTFYKLFNQLPKKHDFCVLLSNFCFDPFHPSRSALCILNRPSELGQWVDLLYK